MNILTLNQDWFAEELRALGHRVMTCGIGNHLDVNVELPLVHIDSLLKLLPERFDPDRIVVYDNSAPIILDGLAETDVPTLFYSVDAHHHYRLHAYLSHVFDFTYIAQKDYLPEFESRGATAEWLPLWASTVLEPVAHKEFGAVFVGTLNPTLNPDRVTFFQELEQVAPVQVQQGSFHHVFPRSTLILNQTVKGDVNFRVFEAMSAGVGLLTERSGNGLFDLFSEGRELLCYEKGDVSEAAKVIHWALDHPEEVLAIGSAGREEILRAHQPMNRALVIEERLKTLEKRHSPLKHFSWMCNFEHLSARLEKIDSNLASQALIRTLRAAEIALAAGSTLNQELAIDLSRACMKHDLRCGDKRGHSLLERVSESMPKEKVLLLTRVRQALNDGDRDRARSLAAEILPVEPESVFPRAEEFVQSLLTEE